MQTIVQQLDSAFRAAINAAFGIESDPAISVSQNERFGDYQSNAAMALAKQLKGKPQTVAAQILEKLSLGEMVVEKPTIAGPGFINVRLSPVWLAARLQASNSRLGIDPVPEPQIVVVDYSAPNIAKEMHVGHIRSTIIGDAITRILAFLGHNVIRQNHIGDWGTQFGRVVLAMWYEAVFDRTGNRARLDELVERARATGPDSVVQELVLLHQKFIDEDPAGEKYFRPYLESAPLQLEHLERVYQFVSAVTECPAAKEARIAHLQHGARTLAELPRLITRFIQDPDEPDNAQEKRAWENARATTIEACKQVYQQLGVQLADPSIQAEPLERGESFYNRYLQGVVRELQDKGLAVSSDGAQVVQVPGFGSPLIIQKADGSYLYGTTDLAAIRFRVNELHAKRILYFVDARQSQHFAQVFWSARAAGWADDVSLEHAPFGTMLGKDNRPFKTRAGDTVKLKELLEEAQERALKIVAEKAVDLDDDQRSKIAHAVGIGAVKYGDLSKDRTSDYVFDWDKMLSFDGNTAPYLQNAYVRIRSIFRKADSQGHSVGSIRLDAPHELALAKHVLRLGEILEVVSRELKPHHLCAYLYDLATRFHAFYEHCAVLQSDEPVRGSRLALCDVTARTLALGLDLLGIEHPEQM